MKSKDPTAKERQKRFRRKWRLAAFKILCGENIQCVKCGIDDFRVLQVDHINAGGAEEIRKSYHSQHMCLVQHIANSPAEEMRKQYQVLCANCNIIKRFENKEAGESVWE